jgi:hypothetical protein
MRYVLVILTLCLLVISAQAGTFKDNFNDGNLDGWKIINTMGNTSEWKIENGVLICRRDNIWISNLVFGEEEWKNYSIECDAKMIQTLDPQLHAMGVDLRLMGELTLVWCAMGDNVKWAILEVWLNDNNGPAKHVDKNFDFQLDRWYHLKGVANKDKFEFYVDGELFLSFTDSNLSAGRIGLSASSCIAYFDNVIITGDEVPGNSSDVDPKNKLATSWGQMKSR